MSPKQFLRDWSLPIAMAGGVVMYFLYTSIPLFNCTHVLVSSALQIIQPGLIFAMLFVTFCKVAFPSIYCFSRWTKGEEPTMPNVGGVRRMHI